jgi:HEPN domain-containing protein
LRHKASEWLKQADYDVETAEIMFQSGRYMYAVFMSHLAMEKALKALYAYQQDEVPPKTHNLLYLLNKLEVRPAPQVEKFLTRLNTASVTTRYPDDLDKIQSAYDAEVTLAILTQSKEFLSWIKSQF